MKSKEELIRLLFLNQCTRQEMEHLLQLIQEDQSEEAPKIMAELFEQLGALPEADTAISARIYEQIEGGIRKAEKSQPLKVTARSKPKSRRFLWLGRAAAAVLLIAGTFMLFQQFGTPEEILEQTAYGEVKEFYLPDSSMVVLNGNSSISYLDEWDAGATRVVHLQGEAYFKVRKKPATQAKFHVVTNDLTVEVLGTAFNVNTFENETQVFLEEGKVKVNLDHEPDQVVNLVPGEVMQYSTIKQQLTPPEKVVQELQPNWRTGFRQFKNTPLIQILNELSQTHQLEFTIIDSLQAQTEYDLALPTQNIEETMQVLGKSIGAPIRRNGRRYLIGSPQNKKE